MSTLKERALAAKAEADAVRAAEAEAVKMSRIWASAKACRDWFIQLGVAPNEIEITGDGTIGHQRAKFVLEDGYSGSWVADGRYFASGLREPRPPAAALQWKVRSSFDKAEFTTLAQLATAMTKADSAMTKAGFEWL